MSIAISDLQICFDAFRQISGIDADGDREVDARLFREFTQLVEEHGAFFGAFATGDLVEAIDEDRRDIVVLGIEAANKAVKTFKTADGVIDGVDQAALMVDIVSELRGVFDAEHAALFVLNGFVNHLNELLRLAEAFQTDNAFYHGNLLLKEFSPLTAEP